MSSFAIIVRKALPQDLPAVKAITHEAFQQYEKDLGMPGHVAALKETDEDILADMEHKNVFIGLIDDEPVGSIRYEVHNGVAYISRFGVINSARHAGMGGNLIETVVRDCRRKGIPAILLHTCARMTKQVRFYYGQGFYIDSTDRNNGYVRALFVRELVDDGVDYAKVYRGEIPLPPRAQ